jgi:hypothetical protein
MESWSADEVRKLHLTVVDASSRLHWIARCMTNVFETSCAPSDPLCILSCKLLLYSLLAEKGSRTSPGVHSCKVVYVKGSVLGSRALR